jgi:hypothetical protein
MCYVHERTERSEDDESVGEKLIHCSVCSISLLSVDLLSVWHMLVPNPLLPHIGSAPHSLVLVSRVLEHCLAEDRDQ